MAIQGFRTQEKPTAKRTASNGYAKGVQDCIRIMNDLFDDYGDYSVVQEVVSIFNSRAKNLINRKGNAR